MIKRKHPLDRAERRRLKSLREHHALKDHDNARSPTNVEVLERTTEEII